ncbi:Importin N-terminal domain-containing protein [Mucor velutinosus]|uniref:Importin N-terminal domain-containing protein n=1 Tax=Mucor velutinosus TaxID=708070 RepID=A0AAN7HVC0_9FUNG|nr:hypothetical protein ATC70_013491 [Mucor velutinosus]KAK4510897.1 hypothetical protein ATC70_000006 [Mucor velutinosus]KAK4521267.1 Importin N-terminal domain-containing protein [Mucor velutinosus]
MSNIVIDQTTIQALVESVKALHSRLDIFERAQQAQQALNAQFREEVNDLHSIINNLEKLIRSPAPVTAQPPIAAIPITPVVPAAQAQAQAQQPRNNPPQWSQVLKRPSAASNKRRREHALRTLQPPQPATENSNYTVLHLHRAHRMTHTEYRATLAAIGIDSKRILDVTFPARNISTILIHTAYKADILQLLAAGELTEVPDFNPLDHTHVADPQFADMPAPQLTRIAAALHTDRCIRTVRYIKKHTVPGVLKFFMAQNWIPLVTAQDLSAELLPRPAKRAMDPHSAVGQLLLDPVYATKLRSRQLVDRLGNVVETNAMEITEEFYDDPNHSDTDDSLE